MSHESANHALPLSTSSAPTNLGSAQKLDTASAKDPTLETEDAEIEPALLPREKVEEFLARKGRNAADLLSAYHTLKDTKYLLEAAAKFPDDPQVQLSVLTKNLFPAERRQWLDRFKASSPDNALANYLSARDYFKNGQDEAGLQELKQAGQQKRFQDFSTEARINEEELQMSAGKTVLEARQSSGGWADNLLGNMASLKSLSQEISRLQKQFAAAGQTQESLQMIEAGLDVVERIAPPEGARFQISQLVAWAIEASLLRGLEPDRSFDFLGGGTPQSRVEEIRAEKMALKKLNDFVREATPRMTEAEQLSFLERQRIYGEIPALRWFQNQAYSQLPK
jgi:hypothetical protein